MTKTNGNSPVLKNSAPLDNNSHGAHYIFNHNSASDMQGVQNIYAIYLLTSAHLPIL